EDAMSSLLGKTLGMFGQWLAPTGGGQPRTLAVMYTDMADSTAFLTRHGARALLVKTERHNRLVRGVIKDHGGTVLRVVGDATQSYFEDPAAAVHCAVKLQRTLAHHNETDPEVELDDHQIHVRVGIHYDKAILYRVWG